MKTYYIGQMQYSSDDIFHYDRKGMKWGKNIFEDIGNELSTQAQYKRNTDAYKSRRMPELYRAISTKDAKQHFIPTRNSLFDLWTGNNYKRTAENDGRNINYAVRKAVKSLDDEGVTGGSKQMGGLVDKYGNFTRYVYGDENDWSVPGIVKLKEDRNWNETQYEKAPRQVVNRAVNSGKEIINNFVGDAGNKAKDIADDIGTAADKAGKAVSKAAGDISNWTSKAAKDVADWGGAQVSKGQKWVDQAVKDVSKTADKAVKGASDWVSNASKDVGKAAKKAASDVSNAADKAVKDTSKWVSNAAKDVGNAADKAGKAVKKAAKSASSWTSNAAKDVGSWGSKQFSKGKSFLKKVFG